MASVLRTESLTKRYGALLVTDAVSLDIGEGELHAIIGPNGAGKTTLINQLSGELAPNSGRVWFKGADVSALPIHERARRGLLRSYQITSIFEDFSVLENATFAALGSRQHAFKFWMPMLADKDALKFAEEALAATGLAHRCDVAAGDLGYGERRQLELAMSLAAGPKFLLLDEPMAGMSVQESAAVIALLQRLKRRYTILLVEHDMDAVFALADRISVLVYGKVLFTGTPEEIRHHPEVRAVYLGEEAEA
ncbi:ABC transporter ATP-binding protein [Polaromonas sp. JS666]|uniref:ABC transporter ATP-binding protein n=1 Tax=Polaromonas sp. (strain JS666 / ATCC BAA-500) TaxID=296591 RepID=UPI00088B1D6F|nr:ABC transporter ATP-binding protein [Polaromonas sp. JS666]SDN94634.1 amino acid/amide ABC transporter ATP-binding protein 1, HAAT family [Polaromonas sp. JS666]